MITGFDRDAVVGMEQAIFSVLNQDTGFTSVLRVVHLYLERLGFYMQVRMILASSLELHAMTV